MIDAAELEERLATLTPIGLGPRGTTRLAWTEEAAAADAWFAAQATAGGLRVERDPAGNLWACPPARPPWWTVASHLDSVRDGGRYDGALGVAAGFAIAAATGRPVGVVSFADEEGARFNTPTFGSRALTGRLDVPDALARTDEDGVALGDAMRAFGVAPEGLPTAPDGLERVTGLLELHIDQSLAVARANRAAAPVSGLAARLRLRAEVRGRADHAGTTTGPERRDALAAAARLVVGAEERTVARAGMVSTAARLVVEPNAFTTVPALARLWLDARAPEERVLADWRTEMEALAAALARERGVAVTLAVEAASGGTAFDPAVRAALARAADAPEVLSYAGHDAGVVATRRPAGMVFVRNRTGVSHAPDEEVDLADAAAGASVLLRALEALG